jgi:outer membrane protein assembly factor BamB
MNVLTRSYHLSRTGANTSETALTPARVASNVLVKSHSLDFNDDPRLEAQPLYVSQLVMKHDNKAHDVVFVCTMANNVWAFNVKDGSVLWKTNLGPPITPGPPPKPNPGFPAASEIDMWGVNIKWGILSTPCIDFDQRKLYVVAWTSADGSVAKAQYELHELDITDGSKLRALRIQASAPGQAGPGEAPATFIPSKQKQRASLLLTKPTLNGEVKSTLFIPFGMTHEDNDPSHGWLIAVDLKSFRISAAWCTSPHQTGVGIWQAGQGPAADEHNAIYLMTGNYGKMVQPKPGDFPESLVKLEYSMAADGTAKLAPVAWFTPFEDFQRNPRGDDDFQDYDLGSAGPVPLPGMGLVVGAGKDGVLYVLDQDNAKFGQGSDFSKLKQQPIFFTYFAGFGIDASQVANLDHLFDGKTHHLHASPAFWNSPARGTMLFCWGENECLRAWTIDAAGNVSFVAKSAEIASARMGGKGGMPGGFLAVTSNGSTPNTGIVWATAPVSHDANKFVVEGILRAYDATALDVHPNADGTPRLKLLWDSKHIPGNTFSFSKFCPPVVADGRVLVPTYSGRVDVYTLVSSPGGSLPTNANLAPGDDD